MQSNSPSKLTLLCPASALLATSTTSGRSVVASVTSKFRRRSRRSMCAEASVATTASNRGASFCVTWPSPAPMSRRTPPTPWPPSAARPTPPASISSACAVDSTNISPRDSRALASCSQSQHMQTRVSVSAAAQTSTGRDWAIPFGVGIERHVRPLEGAGEVPHFHAVVRHGDRPTVRALDLRKGQLLLALPATAPSAGARGGAPQQQRGQEPHPPPLRQCAIARLVRRPRGARLPSPTTGPRWRRAPPASPACRSPPRVCLRAPRSRGR
eukprot:scaffold1590_cov417-Prasinococcus_capsulatus_cf.AAC.4